MNLLALRRAIKIIFINFVPLFKYNNMYVPQHAIWMVDIKWFQQMSMMIEE